MSTFALLPALDVAGGRVAAGTPGRQPTSGTDPVLLAQSWQRAGAEWLHLVDLDAAYGRGSNVAAMTGVVGSVDIDVELSGGVVDAESLARAQATGCRRVVLATAALRNPEWCEQVVAEHGDRVAVALDVEGDVLAPRGSSWRGGPVDDALHRLEAAGCARYLVTDVERDGSLAGPNLDLLARVCALTERPVLASGGVGSLADLRALVGLAPLGVEGAVVGTALHTGAVQLGEALRLTVDGVR